MGFFRDADWANKNDLRYRDQNDPIVDIEEVKNHIRNAAATPMPPLVLTENQFKESLIRFGGCTDAEAQAILDDVKKDSSSNDGTSMGRHG